MRRLLWFLLTAIPLVPSLSAQQPPDAVYYNGKVITADAGFHIVEAFALRGERFTAAGTNAIIKALAGPNTSMVDLHGSTVIPGLMDNHNHQYISYSIEYRGVDLSGITSLSQMTERLRRAAANGAPGQTIFTNARWSESALKEKRGPTRNDLDAASADRPIVVFRARRTIYVNSAGLKAAGIDRNTEALAGNVIEKDSSGEPTGMLTGPATVNAVVDKLVPPATLAEMEEVILKGQAAQHALGLTSIREVELSPAVMRAYYQLWRDGRLTMRVAMGLEMAATDADKAEAILRPWGVATGFGDERLRLDSIGEFAVDGVPGNAYLREPHTDGTGKGILRITPEQIFHAVTVMDQHGWRPSIHITGDAALDAVIYAYEKADAVSPIREKRWIVEHIPLVWPDQMERLSRLGVLVSAQFQPYNGGAGMIESWGKERANASVPMRQLLEHKLLVSAGSDWPGAGTNNPFVALSFYITRQSAKGTVFGAGEKISREEALRTSTINNAYMTFEEKLKGSIEPGKLADFLILSGDILTVPENEIVKLHPLATYVGGKKVYAKPGGGF
jgi:predicted amidohydrolase YtcJ